jgi:hypothetical protein
MNEPSEALSPAVHGVGPLLRRDYWAVIRNARLSPRGIGQLLAAHLKDLAPADWVGFGRHDGSDRPLTEGDLLDVHIRGAGDFGVRVIHRDAQSLTLATVRGHPEAGRITFGAYRNDRGDVVFHIRSHARASSVRNHLGFLSLGDPMQTSTWTDFVDRIANTAGEGVIGYIRADTRRVDDELDEAAMHSPTYEARGD